MFFFLLSWWICQNIKKTSLNLSTDKTKISPNRTRLDISQDRILYRTQHKPVWSQLCTFLNCLHLDIHPLESYCLVEAKSQPNQIKQSLCHKHPSLCFSGVYLCVCICACRLDTAELLRRICTRVHCSLFLFLLPAGCFLYFLVTTHVWARVSMTAHLPHSASAQLQHYTTLPPADSIVIMKNRCSGFVHACLLAWVCVHVRVIPTQLACRCVHPAAMFLPC